MIVIKDTGMPLSCSKCIFKCEKWCYIEIWSNRGVKEVPKEGIPSWCPLTEIKEKTIDKSCKTCKHKDCSAWEEPCDNCYRVTNFEDYWEPYTEDKVEEES